MSFPFVVPRLVSVSRRVVPCRAVSSRVSPCSAACVRQTNVFIFPTERKREKREEREERKKERREGKGAGDKTQYFRLSFSCSWWLLSHRKIYINFWHLSGNAAQPELCICSQSASVAYQNWILEAGGKQGRRTKGERKRAKD